ncbi:MAG TPA: tetratricopeptide repeat protein, partial [Pirellulales bacterium]|nr:tetratricopeptide repeat protein [Pirellulales bacterium]
EWKRDPLFATLPEKYQSAPWFEKLEDKSYDHDLDADFLEEVTWLRDISNHARGRERDDLAVATALFDWTIRNIQLIDPPKPQSPVQQALLDQVLRRVPAEVLLQGEGVAAQRAWVFVLLGRQQKLDIVMLAVPDPDRPDQPRPWLPALVHDGQLYLFDTTLGLPIPGPGGKGIATLTQAAEVESVLASLDLDESHHYPFKATEAKQAMALVEASPGYLSRRMKVLESQLAGDERVVLTASPEQIARRLKGIPHLAPEVKLWAAPYEAYAQRQLEKTGPRQFKELLALEMAPFKVPGFHGSRSTMMKPGERQEALDELVRQGENQIDSRKTVVSRPLRIVFPLWAGRLLHFRGDYDGESGAKHFYMMARPGNDQLGEHVAELVSDYQIANEQAAPRDIIQKYDRVVFRRKQNATYWLGLISFDEGQYQTAEDYFRMAPLEIRPDVPSQWIAGAKYNLARACEAAGRSAEAIKLLEEDDSPQRYGNRLRARRLKEAAKATP